MRIKLSDPIHVDELDATLREAEIVSVRADDSTLVVLHPLATDETEAKIELAFFVKAWCARRPELQFELLG
ncbi:MAG TPA: hypothetical protein VIM18_13965 [Solirubrobacteraceae bacterium]